ncbi:MFS transporter [Chitinophaga rhizosphaerae]|uniref:MFS transporter n=1 Tax=Chitinophaga rhizosphaerae TaxID=1864947 RepID=UPI000F80C44D|nr:MFS transporter [Chitinophaga rhizosphaerae]
MDAVQQTLSPSRSLGLVLGLTQILLWGGSFFLMAIVGEPIVQDTGWPHELVYGALSLALLISGIMAPFIGRVIGKPHGERIMRFSGFVIAGGLAIAAIAPHVAVFFLGWAVVGVGMALGLYDALFAALGKRYGATAGKAFTYITLISGFCTTIIWPLLTLLLGQFGWRGMLLIYAAALLVIIFPVYTYIFPKNAGTAAPPAPRPHRDVAPIVAGEPKVYYLVMVHLTIGAVLMTGMSVHMIDILRNNRLSLPAAVGVGTLLGPSQVGVRFLDLFWPKKSQLTATAISSAGVLTGMGLLLGSPALAAMGIVSYGVGNGMRTILRGTLPLHLFGADGYAALMGKLARPQLIAQAATPFVGGWVIQSMGVAAFVWVLAVLAAVNLLVSLLIRKTAVVHTLAGPVAIRKAS